MLMALVWKQKLCAVLWGSVFLHAWQSFAYPCMYFHKRTTPGGLHPSSQSGLSRGHHDRRILSGIFLGVRPTCTTSKASALVLYSLM